ncbi:endonuclease MutS2 [Chengkuizengella axinellae]|uniref:Endonuclease MutS2 n=1 Tax=Chengkuizengella axinellae TaxID=3064388 RepID=A0ABT9J4T7_9BACL|nr:endonuclease MutS2 [Chengkuizengella sp. 2205SS18-9]MDP5276588.1 endonuclease MutS2 [Chengkuizengella sp. 2205SS18-9]
MNRRILKTMEFDKIIDKLNRHAATALGKNRAAELAPSTKFSEVIELLKATDEAVKVQRLKGTAPFGGIRDISAAIHRARIGGMLNIQELLDVANTIYGAGRLKRFIHKVHDEFSTPLLFAHAKQITDHKKIENAIKACINEHAEMMDSASPELSRIRHQLKTGESAIREQLERMIRSQSVQKKLQEPIVTIRNDRYVLPVKQEYRSYFGGMTHDQSASGATLFIEPEAIVNLNNKLRELKLKEEREIEKILQMLTAQVTEIHDELLVNIHQLAEVDFIFAKAGLAHEMKSTLPRMNDRGFMNLKKARHPLIPEEQIVPIDVKLGDKFDSIIVTGPNTGGKTVSLKTIGLLHLMAMSGLFVPAEDHSQMCVFDGIYADIGDEQSIEQNLSTFSSHMTNIITILKEVTPKSLILLDELGAGTDPTEGSALAISIIEYIHKLGCRLVATTHYSELKAFAYERKGVINASMEFDVKTLSPTYRLLIGVPGRSNAFAIAEKLGLPMSILRHAKGQVNEQDLQVENMIASLEENRISAENDRLAAEKLRREVEQLQEKVKDQKLRFEEQREKLMQKAEEEAREAVRKARKEADQIISDLRKMAMDEKTSIKEHRLIEAKRQLEQAEPQLTTHKSSKSAKKIKGVKNVNPGDEVFVASFNQKGFVVEEANAKEVVVQLGIMKMKVKKTELELISSAEKQVQKQITSIKRSKDQQFKSELDLRGMNLDDSIMEVDRFLDEGILAGVGQVYIIHGKGTGVLRTGIQEFLNKHKHVKQHRLGNMGEGGTGVTVAELK